MGQFWPKTLHKGTSTDLTQADENKKFYSEGKECLQQSRNQSTAQPSHAETCMFLTNILYIICL